MINVRRMEERDVPEVEKIEKAAFSQPWTKSGFLDALNGRQNRYVVAEDEKGIVGYCGFYSGGDQGEIPNVAVKEGHRNQRVGRIMLTELLGIARREGIVSLTLEVRASNESAIRLYEKLGFTSVGVRRGFYEKPKEDGIVMMRKEIIRCRCCKKEAKEKNGIVMEDFFHIQKEWGYFSNKDGIIHDFYVCEECYDKWVKQFEAAPEEVEALELL